MCTQRNDQFFSFHCCHPTPLPRGPFDYYTRIYTGVLYPIVYGSPENQTHRVRLKHAAGEKIKNHFFLKN